MAFLNTPKMARAKITKTLFSGAVLDLDEGYGRHKRIIVDTETGEILCEKYMNDPRTVFEMGANACIAEVMVSREHHPDRGECFYASVVQPERLTTLGTFWQGFRRRIRNAMPKHTGGRPAFAKLFLTSVQNLSVRLNESELGFLLKLATLANWRDGELVSGEKKSLTMADMAARLKCPLRTMQRYVKKLREENVLQTDAEGRYFISPAVLRKG